MIIVTGATGQLGRATVQQLLTRLPASQIGVSVRQPEQAADFQAQGVRVRQGDFAEPHSLRHAFEGASQVFIVSANATGDEVVRLHRNAIEAAREAGARRLVYTSHMGANPDSLFAPMWGHAATETMLRDSGLPFTSLRNGFYADSALQQMGQAPESGTLAAPQDGPVSWTAHADLAEAAAILLTEEGRFDGPTPPLTASEALDLSALAAIASQITGRPIERAVTTDDEYRERLIRQGLPGARAEMLVGMYRASRQGEFATVDPTLAQLLGRRPVAMRAVLEERLRA